MKRLLIIMVITAIAVSMIFFGVSCKEAVEEAAEEVEEAAEEVEEAAEEVEEAAEEVEEEAEEASGGIKEEIVYLTNLEVKSMDPIYTEGYMTMVCHLFYDPLIKLTKDGYEGVLAETFDISDDGLTITFNLRQGIKFHDGTDFNADVVKWNIDRARMAEDSIYYPDLQIIEEVTVIDDYTVEVKLSALNVDFIDNFCNPVGYMVSPAAVEEYGKEDFNLTAVGTGGYLFEEWSSGNRVVGVRNPDYWRKDEEGNQLPYSDKAIIRFVLDASVALIEVQTGNADGVLDNLVGNLEAAEADSNLQLIDPGMGAVQYVEFNSSKEPYNNEKFRQAIVASIDRKTIGQVIAGEFAQFPVNMVSPFSWVYDPDLVNPYEYDAELAKQLFEESGVSPDVQTEIAIIKRDPDIEISQLVQDYMLQAGINNSVKIMERQAAVDYIVINKAFEICAVNVNTLGNRGPFLLNRFYGAVDAPFNRGMFNDPELFDLITKASQELDREERYKLYSEAQQLALEGAYFSCLFMRPYYIIATKNIVDYDWTSTLGGTLSLVDTKIMAE
jgi:peptide/nickel transport system substrate-binding protein